MSSELSFRERERACTQDLQRSKKKMFFMPYGVVCNLPYIDGWTEPLLHSEDCVPTKLSLHD